MISHTDKLRAYIKDSQSGIDPKSIPLIWGMFSIVKMMEISMETVIKGGLPESMYNERGLSLSVLQKLKYSIDNLIETIKVDK